MKRLYIVLVTNPDCESDRAEHMLEKMGHVIAEVYDAKWALEKIGDNLETPRAFDAVIIDGFCMQSAELIALAIKIEIDDIYIGIMSTEAEHRTPNVYGDEVIPEKPGFLKEALECRFPDDI